MATLRNMINGFIYPFIERITDMVYKGGADTVWHGVRVLDDDIKFTHGALVNAAATLYVRYVQTSDERADEVLRRIHYFIKIAASNVCKTWGKVAILRAFNELYENGLLERIDPEYIELVKDKTNYEDFFDKETLELKNMATNYYQVAMLCAGLREKLGWESDGYAERIKDKLVGIMSAKSINGWMDDEIPYGRFDRYSIVLASEFADTASLCGLEVPDLIKTNLYEAAKAVLFMANEKGDGVIYGRSVACHGDLTAPEVLSSALAEGLLDEKEREIAVAYSLRVYEKVLSFWYNGEKGCFDVWWGGRSYNDYRPLDRILETNLDMANHLYMALKNFDAAGVADLEPSISLSAPDKWQSYELDFMKLEGDVKKTVIMRRGDTMLMLPFVGLGSRWGRKNAYYAFPAICRVIEASPESELPFMLPEYTDENGVTYRPCQYYDLVDVAENDGGVTVEAKGYLSIATTCVPKRSDVRFKMTFRIVGESISMRVETDKPMKIAEMITGSFENRAKITAVGFDTGAAVDSTADRSFCGIHGRITGVKHYEASAPGVLGYDMTI